MVWTRPPGGRSFGVTFFQVLPSSRVTHTGPSLEPVQITPGSSRDGRMAYSALYTSSPVTSRVIGSPEITCLSERGEYAFLLLSGVQPVSCGTARRPLGGAQLH